MKQTLNRIDAIMGRVRTHPEYSRMVRTAAYNALVADANRYSLAIENLMQSGRDERKFGREEKEKCFKCLEEGREYLGREGVSIGSLSTFGHIIAPKDHEGNPTPKGYRLTNVTFGGGLMGALPETIPLLMDGLVYFANNGEVHPVIRAAATHLEMVRIQPYIDGNSRSARTLQNHLLEMGDFPPAVITDREKDLYLTLRSGVYHERDPRITSRATNPTQPQQAFYAFIASKVLDSSSRLEDELKKSRFFEVDLTGVENKGICYSITKSLKGMARHRGHAIKASFSNGERKKFKVHINGDIGLAEVAAFFEKIKERYALNFSVVSVRD